MSRSRFEELARRWVPGEGPVEVQPLSTGLVNESCRVLRGDRAFSLRSSIDRPAGLGLDRDWECAVLAQAAIAGVAPNIRRCEPRHGILVAEWVGGRAWSPDEVRLPVNIDAMAQLLRRVHALDIPRPARQMDPRAWIAHYSAALGPLSSPTRRSVGLRGAADEHLATLAKERAPAAVLCHGDLHRLNVVIGEGLVLLDWEYSHAADAFWDLAGWAANNDWTESEAERLVESYLQRPLHAADRARLRHRMWLYDYVCLLWSELIASRAAGTAHPDILGRADIVARRL